MNRRILGMIPAGALLALASTAFVAPAQAGPVITLSNRYGCCSTYPAAMGWSFTANTDFTVDQLGFFDADFDGLLFAHRVALWDVSTRAIVVQGTVAAGTTAPLVGGFRYVDVADTDLVGGRQYFAMAEFSGDVSTNETDSAFQFGQTPAGTMTVDPRITLGDLGRAPFESSGLATFPDEGWIAHFGPGFRIADPTPPTRVPEPATLPLALGAIAAAAWGTGRKGGATAS